MEIRLTNDPADLKRALAALAGFSREQGLPLAIQLAADLTLTEHLTNIVVHGCEPSKSHHIEVRIEKDPGWLRIEVEDDGKPFNLLEHPVVDTSVPLDDKPVGGLGVHMIRSSMDEIDYRRVDGRNVLSMRKRVD